MRERPILFSAPMVRAILEGRKSVTRRVVQPQPIYDRSFADDGLKICGKGKRKHDASSIHCAPLVSQFCPYGKPGDRLWVRETFAYVSPDESARPSGDCNIEYRADKPRTRRAGDWDEAPDDPEAIRWKPSIHMPRAASRITLEMSDVRVERLREISINQIKAEGVQIPVDSVSGKVLLDISTQHGAGYFMRGFDIHNADALLRAHWAALWVAINGIDSWIDNPWVWVVEFKKVPQ
jgi:hypothetical protein